MNTTSPVTVTRTWKLDLFGSYGEGSSARVNLGSKTVTLSGGRDSKSNRLPLVAQIDGQDATAAEAVSLLNWAKAEGRVQLVSEVRIVPTIGNAAAHQLHRTLARLGYRAHYALASEVLGREVVSLAALTAEDAATVRSYAYGQLGLVTGSAA